MTAKNMNGSNYSTLSVSHVPAKSRNQGNDCHEVEGSEAQWVYGVEYQTACVVKTHIVNGQSGQVQAAGLEC